MGEARVPWGSSCLEGSLSVGEARCEVMLPIVGEPDAHGGGGVHGLWNWSS